MKKIIALLSILVAGAGGYYFYNINNQQVSTELFEYVNIEKITEEIENAKKTFRKYNWPVIDVTRKSVEETAASVIKIHEITKKNG